MKKLIVGACMAVASILPAGAALADEGASRPIVHTEECPPGYIGRTVYVADRGFLWGCYVKHP